MHAHAQSCWARFHPVDCKRQVKRKGDLPKRLVLGGGKTVRSPHPSGRILSLNRGFNGVQSGTKSNNTWLTVSTPSYSLKASSMKWLGLWEWRGVLGGSVGKESTCQFRRPRRRWFDPWAWKRAWQPTPVFLPGNAHGQESGGLQSIWSQRVGHNWSDWAGGRGNRGQNVHFQDRGGVRSLQLHGSSLQVNRRSHPLNDLPQHFMAPDWLLKFHTHPSSTMCPVQISSVQFSRSVLSDS